MSDGQFSSKPMRSAKAHGAWAGDFTADPSLLSQSARSFIDSRAVQREIEALLKQPFPDIGLVTCAPLHRNTPEAAKELGRPLASAALVQEYLIGLLFLRFFGWIFLLCGALFLLGAVIGTFVGLSQPPRPGGPHPLAIGALIAGIGLGIGGAGVWFGILRGRVITEMCWFCPRGMIWVTNGAFEWYTWEEIREVHCRLMDDRPAIGIRFDQNLSIISFSNTHASRLMVEHIENRASSACAQRVLQLIADGEPVRFGAWRLGRAGIRSRDEEIDWRNVSDVHVRDRLLRIKHRDGTLTIDLDETPFPSLFLALTLGIYAHVRESTS